ncbi:MAG: biotin/lipoyl-containing protein [Candidatus Sericytochromatia bacterium]
MAYFRHQHQLHEVRELGHGQFLVDGEQLELSLERLDEHAYLLRQGQRQQALHVHQRGDGYQVWYQGELYDLSRQSRAALAEEDAHSGRIEAPLTGKVILVDATPGAAVAKGATLVVLESMKMETALSAPMDATVKSVHCAAGDQVGNGQLLIELIPKEAD